MPVNETGTITLKILAQDLASGNVGKFIGNIDRLAKQGGLMGSVMQGVGQSFGQMLNPVALVGNAISTVTNFMGDSIDAASDQAEALSKVTVVFGDQADEIKKWAETAADSMGMTTTAALESAGTLGNLFDALGLAEDKSADMSKAITQLAADLGSFNNVASEEAMTALQSGLLGETEPMRRFGANLSAARVEAYALSKGMAATAKGITDAIKVQARYELILEDTKNAQGDYARTSDGLANSTKSLNARFGDLTVKIGQLMEGPANLFVGFLDDVIGKLAPSGASSLPPRIQGLIDQFGELEAAAESASSGGTKVRVTLDEAAESLRSVAEIQRLGGNFMSAKYLSMLGPEFVQIANNLGVTTEQLGSLVFEGVKAKESFEEIRSAAFAAVNGTENATTSMVDAWTLGTKYMGEAAVEAGEEIKSGLVRPVKSTFAAMFQTMAAAKEPWKAAWKEMAAYAKNPFRPEAFERWLSRRAKRAAENAAEAAEKGKHRVARRWQALADVMSNPVLAALATTQEEIDALIAAMQTVTLIGNRTGTTTMGSNVKVAGRASGGPVLAGQTYRVGEESEETLVMGRNGGGYVIPGKKRAGGNGGGNGGVTLNISFHSVAPPTEAEGQRLADAIWPALARKMQRQGD